MVVFVLILKVFFNYRLFSIFVKIIYGYFKGYGYNLIKFFKYVYLINYVWNVVYVVGQWCLIDCMLGVGIVDEDGYYIWEFENFYFLIDFDQLILIYFLYMEKSRKESRLWQFFQKLVILQVFSKYVNRIIIVFKWGVEFVFYSEVVIFVMLFVIVFLKGIFRIFYNVLVCLMDINGKILKRYILV